MSETMELIDLEASDLQAIKNAEKPRLLDTFTWCAIYNDGDEEVWECDIASLKLDTDGRCQGCVINKYGKLDRPKLTAFSLYRTADLLYPATAKPIVTVDLKPGYRLIWRKRQRLVLVGAISLPTIYLIGWQVTVNGTNIQSILYIYPDGTTELSCRKSDFELFEFEK